MTNILLSLFLIAIISLLSETLLSENKRFDELEEDELLELLGA
jgi:hypothetical protein